MGRDTFITFRGETDVCVEYDIDASATGPQPKVTVYIDGTRAVSVGPFADWRTAERLAQVIRATVRTWTETAREHETKN